MTNSYMNDIYISIHAPVKGATGRGSGTKVQEWNISIHAPVKGATSFRRNRLPS